MLSPLRAKYGDDILEQSVTVCSGLDMVNIGLCHFVFPDKKVAEVSEKKRERDTEKRETRKKIISPPSSKMDCRFPCRSQGDR